MDGSVLKGVAAILWPIITAWAVFLFRIELRLLLFRLRRVGKGVAEFSESRISAQAINIPLEKALENVAPGEKQDSFIIKSVAVIRDELNRLQPDNTDARESLLLLRLAQRQQERNWALFWLNIFASQLAALESMAAENSIIDLTKFYDAHVDAYNAFVATRENPSPVATFDVWVRFLVTNHAANVEEKRGSITDIGIAFLAFAKQQNLPRFQAW